ncbi:MAG: hypothetical protein EXS35_15900 [Pedosphaera sp.]|nr:hypothetical protein [Pedosphaera sp.]
MNLTPKILATLGVAAAVVVLGLWFSGLFTGRSSPPGPAVNGGDGSLKSNKTILPSPGETIRTNRGERLLGAFANDTNKITRYEPTIETILSADGEPDEKGAALLALYPRFPPEGQALAAQHIANLLANDDYEPFGQRLADTNTTAEVQEVILADVLGRPNKLKLPLLLEVAKTPAHPKAAESKQILELYLEKNYGDDWETWKTKIADWLRDNPN